jgi:L-ascorbate metabolism protein UlaG (beta-lactamase superfamily)
VALVCLSLGASSQAGADKVAIHNLGHSSVYFEYNDLVIHVDPYSAVADYDTLPDADIILVTHGHPDHYDLTAISKITKTGTEMVTTQAVNDLASYTGTIQVLDNGDSTVVMGIPVKAVPAYNVINTNFHPKGVGNGYVLTFGEKKVYVAGDSENIPEMRQMGSIDIAFLPMNLPYTMTPAEVTTAALNIMPDILYVYHFGTSDTALVRALLRNYIKTIRIGKSVSIEDTQEPPTSNSDLLGLEPAIGFYPNPVKDHVIISKGNPGAEVSVYDLAGKLLLKEQLTGQGDQRLDLKSLAPGAYLLKYKDQQFIKSSMIVKE